MESCNLRDPPPPIRFAPNCSIFCHFSYPPHSPLQPPSISPPFSLSLSPPAVPDSFVSPRVCCDKAQPAAGRATIVSERRDCHWSAVFDYSPPLSRSLCRTLNSAPLISFLCALQRLKIASCLASTPSAAKHLERSRGRRWPPPAFSECYLPEFDFQPQSDAHVLICSVDVQQIITPPPPPPVLCF